MGSAATLSSRASRLFAQPVPGRPWRIGILSVSFPRGSFDSYLRALRELGYEEGRNLIVDFKFGQGSVGSLQALAAELLATKPDVLVGVTNIDVDALRRATIAAPIVMLYASEPVLTGLIASLARPGGNITGTTTNAAGLAGKMTEVMRDAVPKMRKVVWLADPDYPGMNLYRKSVVDSAQGLGIRAVHLDVRTLADLNGALALVERDRPDFMGLAMTSPVAENARRIVEFAARLRLPCLYSTNGPVRFGGLMSYGPDFGELQRSNAMIVDKLLKGAKPAEIPVEEPAKFMLSVNLKTATAMQLAIPQALLMRADEVIQ